MFKPFRVCLCVEPTRSNYAPQALNDLRLCVYACARLTIGMRSRMRPLPHQHVLNIFRQLNDIDIGTNRRKKNRHEYGIEFEM